MKTTKGIFAAAIIAMSTLVSFANEGLRVEITKSDITCFGQANGKAELYIAGGHAPYAINWSNGQNTSAISDLKKGMYVVTVTDAKGNSVKDSVKITMPAPISVSYNTPRETATANFNAEMNILVNGGTPWEMETAAPMYMFRLNDKTYYEHPEKLEDGIYKLTIEDARGCKLTTNINLQVQVENAIVQKEKPAFNGNGNVQMTVKPIHLVIEQNKKTITQNYN
ncbi:MAG: SprB repeat-containing protein [Cryomorphaceae bacterium]|jgi:hypothetical protein|nr:SprB repeat-containing protein [Cryomorphaceae bacterium]